MKMNESSSAENRIMPSKNTCRVASVAYSLLLLSSDLCNNPVIFGFAGTPGYTQKISLDCDEHHQLPQTQGTSPSEKICFFLFVCFSLPSISIKKAQRKRDMVFHLLLLSEPIHSSSVFMSLLFRVILFSGFFSPIFYHAVVHTNFISLFFPSIASALENKLFDL